MIMTTSIEKMCRTCMLNETKRQETENKTKVKMKVTQMVPIFDDPKEAKEKLNLVELIKSTIPQLKIEKNDELPKHVCLECSDKIKEIYSFQQNCIDVEQKFYKLLEQEDSINPLNETEEQDDEVFKTEFNDSFIDENSLNSKEEAIMEEEINEAANAKEEFIESCSDWSIDLIWDDKSDTEWDQKNIKSKLKMNRKTMKRKNDLVSDEMFNVFKDGLNKLKSKATKSSVRIAENNAKGIYPCNRCKRKLKSKLSFINHQKMHDKRDKEGRIFECNICSKAFTENSLLKEHQRSHIGERPFLCSECGKGFTSAGSLKQHSFRHLDQKLFPCPDCPRSFPTKTDMLSHYDIHKAKPRNHICDVCGRGFYKPYLLKQHNMYHNNDRPFACEFCDKRFVTSEKVKRHTRIHTGEKPYKCNFCEKSYCQSSELIKHLRVHLGENVYQCELCPLKFKTVKILRTHFSSHKNDDEETKARNLVALNEMEMKGMFVK